MDINKTITNTYEFEQKLLANFDVFAVKLLTDRRIDKR